MPWQKIFRDALILWATIDPVSTLVIFIGLTKKQDANERKRTARRTIIYAGVILLVSAIIGQFVLIGMGISILAFQVAGGIVLFLFAIKLIFEDFAGTGDSEGQTHRDPAVYPLAFPSIATPGAILAIIVLTDNQLYPIKTQTFTVAIALIILLITYIVIRNATRVLALITEAGAELLIRVMGLLLAALSIQLIYDALVSL